MEGEGSEVPRSSNRTKGSRNAKREGRRHSELAST